MDYVRTDAAANQLRLFPGTTNYGGLLPGVNTADPSATNLSDNDILYAFYATNNVKIGDHWTFDAGFGQGQRPPTLIEALRRRPVHQHLADRVHSRGRRSQLAA